MTFGIDMPKSRRWIIFRGSVSSTMCRESETNLEKDLLIQVAYLCLLDN